MKKIYRHLLRIASLIFFVSFAFSLSAQNNSHEELTIEECFEAIESTNRFIDSFQSLDETSLQQLPIGIKKIAANMPVTLAITKVKLGEGYGEISLFMKMEIPQQSRTLMFGATNIKISYGNDLLGNVKLSLLNDQSISLGNMGNVVLKGSFDEKTGADFSDTYVTLDCNGDFQELSLSADVILNKNTFRPVNSQETVVASSFRVVVHDWNDLLAEVSFPPFEIAGANGFEFTLSNATLDLSDCKNSAAFDPPSGYMAEYFTLPEPMLWRGVYVDRFEVKFPEWFKKKSTNERISLEANQLLIDENGITGNIAVQNILSLQTGDAGGWPFSVNDFQFSLIANNIQAFGFKGQIHIPIGENQQLRNYEAFISKDEYLFNVSLGEVLDMNLFGASTLHLEPTSYLQMHIIDNQFIPSLSMDGYMSLDADMLKMEEIVFEKMVISPRAPYLTVESMGYGGEVGLNNFPLTISNINFHADNDQAALQFEAKLNLMEKAAISAQTKVTVRSSYKEGSWKYQGFSVDKILLDNVELAGFSLAGEIELMRNDPDYGNYFGGNITATFDAFSNDLAVNVKSVFGRKDFRYWYVEGIAKIGKGIPIGPVFLDGFVGGAYYKMQFTGNSGTRSYAPYEECGLGVKAGVHYYIAQQNTVSGNALLEMNFSSSGGIRNILFYGTAEFLKETSKSDNMLEGMFTTGQGKIRCVGQSFTAGLSSGLSGSAMSKEILAGMNLSGIISAYMTMNYEFTTKTFDANFAVMINTPGGILQGAGSNGEAGWANLHLSPNSWYIHAGTPTNPLGLKLGLGPLSLSTESYFMLGDKLETPILDPNVARILGLSPQQADYMKLPQNIPASGKGVAFGSRFKFDTGDLTFLVLYARFMAGTGFDVMLQDMSNYSCKGRNEPIGLNNWYANGQCYAYLQGELGVKINLLFIKKKVSIIKGSTAALLQARLPNPTWVGGYMAINLDVLGGLIKANMKMKFSFGDDCELVRNDGEYSPLDFPIIADLSPKEGDTDVDIFLSPQATFNMQLEEPFDTQDDNGDTRTYRIMIEDFYVADNTGKKIVGQIKKGKNMDASFVSHDVLPPYNNMTAFISVNFEERVNGAWNLVSQDGKPARETRTVKFKTGEAPNYIPISNILYCYPVIEQKNFYKGESTAGFVQLDKGQSYLFPAGFNYDVSFTSPNRQDLKAGFNYNAGEKRVNYTIPALVNRADYEMAFVASKEVQVISGPATITSSTTIKGESDDESYTVDYMQQAAQKIIQDGSLKVLDYKFGTSSFNTFEQKMSSFSLTRGAIVATQDVHVLYLKAGSSYERFDEAELEGVPSSRELALIRPEAVLDDSYYTRAIYPLLYQWYPMNGISIQNRNPNDAGVPPVKGFYILDGYFTGNADAQRAFPLAYNLVHYYKRDFTELRNKAANMFDIGINMAPLLPLIQSQFPLILEGNYKTRLKYMIPGDKQGTQKLINYIYWY